MSFEDRLSIDNLRLLSQQRMIEWTFESKKVYQDPFNEVEVDAVFRRRGEIWRVPAFWRGEQKWTVRFAPPSAGEYAFELESTDPHNPDFRKSGSVRVLPYSGESQLLRHGSIHVSKDGRHFEHADGTPFYWLGDTWWMGLSDRLNWEGFQSLVADRRSKGFTLVQIVAGLVPLEEPPQDPGFCNEGGCVWGTDFTRINPRYFDYADRRVQLLVESEIVPAIVGAWGHLLPTLGIEKMKKHWRYLVARYGAYPVIWIVGGEVIDPPAKIVARISPVWRSKIVTTGWTEVAQYVRDLDPYHHLLSAHEAPPSVDFPLQDEALTDFDLLQSSQFGWSSLHVGIAQLNMHYARTAVVKPIVQGEIGYENHFYRHYEDFQRAAFWLSMLNGAAGYTYGADGTWGAYTGDKPLPAIRLSFLSWREGMNLTGSYQVGLGAKLLRQYEWWKFAPRPDWITPRGDTFLEPREDISGDELGSYFGEYRIEERIDSDAIQYPRGSWIGKDRDFDEPYAAGIPGELRFVYIPVDPNNLLRPRPPPTVLGLEIGRPYRAFLWEPSFGIRFDLGVIERPEPGPTMFRRELDVDNSSAWVVHDCSERAPHAAATDAEILATVTGLSESDLVAEVALEDGFTIDLIVRFLDVDNFVAATYSTAEHSISIIERRDGKNHVVARTTVARMQAALTLSMELRGGVGAASISDGQHRYTTPIVPLKNNERGGAGVRYKKSGSQKGTGFFTIRRSPVLVKDVLRARDLVDARGELRGTLEGHAWSSFGDKKYILLDAYRPEILPTGGDWVLVMDARGRNGVEGFRGSPRPN